MNSPDLIVEASNLLKSYNGKPAVRGIDLKIRRGGCFGLLGPNGAGKTTTLRMILGQCRQSGGQLSVLGLPMPASSREVRSRIGVVPQLDNLDPDFTVRENLVVYAGYFGLRPQSVHDRISELLQLVELTDRTKTRINELSGGMKRRLSVARSLVNDPEVLILDEPTTGLDPQVRHLIWNRLLELKRSGKTLILTTHYMEEAERLCDELVIMDHGEIVTRGTPRELIRGQVEPDVVEIRGFETSRLPELPAGVRTEVVGETLYCYTRESAALVERLEAEPHISYLHRPANLEDVFLKLTGRELRE